LREEEIITAALRARPDETVRRNREVISGEDDPRHSAVQPDKTTDVLNGPRGCASAGIGSPRSPMNTVTPPMTILDFLEAFRGDHAGG
jgi:hypothetical protein